MNKTIYTVGFWSALAAFAATLGYVVVQLLQVAGVLPFPLDEILIYGTSMGIVVPFVMAVLALHYITPPERRLWSHAALLFTTLYAVFVSANYVVQLATVIPLKRQGRVGEVQLLEQTPHSLFWDMDALGYIFMGLALLVAAAALSGRGFQRWVRWAFLAHGLMTPLISIVYFAPDYSNALLVLGYPWGVTAPLAMLLLALLFRREAKGPTDLGRGCCLAALQLRVITPRNGRRSEKP